VPDHVLEVFGKADSGWISKFMGPLMEIQRETTMEGRRMETFETGALLLTGETAKLYKAIISSALKLR
jgi:hypothetical protein